MENAGSPVLRRFAKDIWDVLWMDYGKDEDLAPFLDTLDKKVRKRLEARLTAMANIGPQDVLKPLTGLERIFEYKYDNVRLLMFYSKVAKATVIVGHGYLKQGQKLPPSEKARAIKRRDDGEYLPPPK
jgi:phage-related protein